MSKIVICMECDHGIMFMDAIRVMDLTGKHPLGFVCKECSQSISEEMGLDDVILDIISEVLSDQEIPSLSQESLS